MSQETTEAIRNRLNAVSKAALVQACIMQYHSARLARDAEMQHWKMLTEKAQATYDKSLKMSEAAKTNGELIASIEISQKGSRQHAVANRYYENVLNKAHS